jgi:hypothetical protein
MIKMPCRQAVVDMIVCGAAAFALSSSAWPATAAAADTTPSSKD